MCYDWSLMMPGVYFRNPRLCCNQRFDVRLPAFRSGTWIVFVSNKLEYTRKIGSLNNVKCIFGGSANAAKINHRDEKVTKTKYNDIIYKI